MSHQSSLEISAFHRHYPSQLGQFGGVLQSESFPLYFLLCIFYVLLLSGQSRCDNCCGLCLPFLAKGRQSRSSMFIASWLPGRFLFVRNLTLGLVLIMHELLPA